MSKHKSADDLANEMLSKVDLSHAICNQRIEGLRETVTELLHENERILKVLQRVVNGATSTMGVDSIDRQYAHITQNVLDLGRDTLRESGLSASEPAKRFVAKDGTVHLR